MLKKFILSALSIGIPFGLIMFLFEYFDNKEINYVRLILKSIIFSVLYTLFIMYKDLKKQKNK